MATSSRRCLTLSALAVGLVAAHAQATLQLTTATGDTLLIEPFGAHSLRVRARIGGGSIDKSVPGALLSAPTAESTATVHVGTSEITNGNIAATVDAVTGLLTISRVSDGAVLLSESERERDPSTGAATVAFAADARTAVYGFGEHQQGKLDMVGSAFDMEQCLDYGHSRGGEVCLPFVLGGRGVAGGGGGGGGISPNCVETPLLGCYHDEGGGGRVFPVQAGEVNQNDLTLEKCAGECDGLAQEGYKYFAVESGTQCYCSRDPPTVPASRKLPDEACNQPCAGNATQRCGAAWTAAVHTIQCPPPAPTPAPAPGMQPGIEYGLLWNMPNYGSVDFAKANASRVTWVAQGTAQVDWFVTTYGDAAAAGTAAAPAAILSHYVDATGHSPMLPRYAAGYWHSKNRYASQDELLAAAAGFHNRSIPVGVIVIDYHHWVNMGDWSFDSKAWPNVPAMMETLKGYGMRVMVSAWPFSATGSGSIANVSAQGLAVMDGANASPVWWDDNNCNAKCYLLDQSEAATRRYFWQRLNDGYFKYGIDVFWLDASEPEISTSDARQAALNSTYSQGNSTTVGMMFPFWHTQAVHDGLRSAGRKDGEIIMLTRSAWAGMQRWGAALWSGDTHSSFDSLKVSIPAGLNTQMSGIAWWTTDIGGYAGGNPADPTFRELIVRWFQYGATCPLFRQHGARPTEIWGYGNASYAAIRKVIAWRAEKEGYVMAAMREVADSGLPVNRPLWWDFPADPQAWEQTQSYMFGPTYLVAPVTEMGARWWSVYLPTEMGGAGGNANDTQWKHEFSGTVYHGGQTVNITTPLDEFPLFSRL